jgi:hypothetical protein
MKNRLFMLATLMVFALPLSSFKSDSKIHTLSKPQCTDVEFGDFEENGVVYAVYGSGGVVHHVYEIFNGNLEVLFSDASYNSSANTVTITLYVSAPPTTVTNRHLEFY